MDPVLIGRHNLRAPARGWGGASVPLALASLLAIVIALGAAQASVHDPAAGPVALRTTPTVTYISGTQIPAPPASFAFHSPSLRQGVFVMRPGKGATPITLSGAGNLYASYLSSMAGAGWTLVAQQVPSPAGEWTLNWQFQTQTAVVQFFMTPKPRLDVTICPPNPYC